MSMWLTLAKIEPALLQRISDDPEQLDAVFDSTDSPGPLDGFDAEKDSHGEDFRALSDIAEGRAEVEEGTTDWVSAYPELARATGHNCAAIEDYDFGYGPAFLLDPREVQQVAAGLTREGWAGFIELGPFYAAAAAEGKAVVGGLN